MTLRSSITLLEHLADCLRVHYIAEKKANVPVIITKDFSYNRLRNASEVPKNLEERFGKGSYYKSGFEDIPGAGRKIIFVFRHEGNIDGGKDTLLGAFAYN